MARPSQPAARTSSPPHDRLAFLDILRGIAAVAVFVVHAGANNSNAFAAFRLTRFDLGVFGVTLFFLCSGFIVPVSLERSGSLRHFWINRVFRLYPLYWCSILLTVVSAAAGFGMAADTITNFGVPDRVASLSPTAVLANLTMLQMFLRQPHLLGLYWTLTYEMIFYLMLSVFFVLNVSRYSVPLAYGMVSVAVLLEVVLPWTIGLEASFGLISNLATMFVGTALYRLWSGAVTKRAIGPLPALVLIMLIGTAGQPAEGGFGAVSQRMWANIAAYAVFGGALALRTRPGSMAARPAGAVGQYLGRISYSLYLLHPLVLLLVPRQENLIASMALWLGVLIGVSTITYRWIEVPAMNLGRAVNRAVSRSRRAPDTGQNAGARSAA